MSTFESDIYRFKINLKDIRPLIWRRIEVPGAYTFWDLHCAIQDAFGWQDAHLHQFRIGKQPNDIVIGIPNEDLDMYEILPGWDEQISERFDLQVNKKAIYEYDFGDDWEHNVLLEKIAPAEKGFRYPRCMDGGRACPPEDCGGSYGYTELIEIISDPHNRQYKEMTAWLGVPFDPEAFDIENVTFADSRKRLRMLKKNLDF
jgi:hypothetical protein